MIIVTNLETGEITRYKGVMMVAPNGMVFIKQDRRVLFASAAPNFVAEDKGDTPSGH